ncbi:MAG: hypothetical protein ACRETU_00480 [Steroidobacterales bacterium]
MDIGALLSLQRAAPVLLRHLSAYAELAGQDLAASRLEFAARARSALILVVSAVFALVMLCACVIAATWDTPYRLVAVASLAALFVIIAGAAAIHLARSPAQRAFAAVRREWRQDRALIEQLVANSVKDEAHAGR